MVYINRRPYGRRFHFYYISMPHLLTIRQFVEGGYYHVFNRGNGRKTIFHDANDYKYFYSTLTGYLLPPQKKTIRNNYYGKIEIFSYVLMPNHIHLLVRQFEERAIAEFMRSISLMYARYYNKRYNTVGHLFQDKYKARLVTSTIDVLHMTRYIHLNPLDLSVDIENYAYSSLKCYCHGGEQSWLHVRHILDIFGGTFGISSSNVRDAYRLFVLMHAKEHSALKHPQELRALEGF